MEAALTGVSGRVELGEDRLSIGRAPNTQLVLTDSQVSGYHAEVRLEGDGYCIVDLGSSNGTFVNGYRLTPNVPRALNPNDQLQFGQHFGNPLAILTYQVQDAAFVEPTVLASPPSANQSQPPQQGYPPPPPPSVQSYQPRRQENQVKAQPRPSIREIVSGHADYKAAAGMSEKELADLLAPLS